MKWQREACLNAKQMSISSQRADPQINLFANEICQTLPDMELLETEKVTRKSEAMQLQYTVYISKIEWQRFSPRKLVP